MKIAIAVLLLAVASVGTTFAQNDTYKGIANFPVSSETGLIVYDSVVTVEGRTAQELYSAAKEWVARNSDSRYSIELDMPGEKLSGKGRLVQSSNPDHSFEYDFYFSFKDGRYKYEITNLIMRYDYGANVRGSYALETYPKKDLSGNKAKKLDAIYKSIDTDIRRTAGSFATLESKAKKEDW